MPADPSIWSTALQLGIGGLSVAGIIYVSLQHAKTQRDSQSQFLRALESQQEKHATIMEKREESMRQLENSFRTNLTEQLTKNTVALLDATKVLGRVVRHLDNEKN